MNQTSLIGRPLAALTAAMVGFAEKRGIWSGPLMSNSPELARLWASPPTSTGVSVSEMSALTYSVVWACVNNISTDLASLPLILYKNLPNGGKERLTRHKLYRVLHDEPNPEMSTMTFRGVVQAHVLTWGNGYAEIVRDGAGQVVELWPLTPDRVCVKRDTRTGAIYYEVSRIDSGIDRLPAADMLHIQGLGYDGSVGYDLIAKAREAIALGLATQQFGGSFFGNGATFGGVISLKTQLTEAAKKSFMEQMAAQHQGIDRAHKFLLLGNEAAYQKLGVDPDHAQFLETRDKQIEEICRYYRMPPHKVQHLLRSTNNNIEHQGIEYYSDTLRPWCVRWEQEIKRKLIAPSERLIQFAEHKIEGVLRGDQKSRYDAYAVGRQWGWLSANRICELENMDPLPAGGDVFLVPMNMAPADRLNEIVDKQVTPDPTPAQPVDPSTSNQDAARMVETLRAALVEIETRIADHVARATAAETELAGVQGSNSTLEALATEQRTLADQERLEAGKLKALLLMATERADRLEAEKAQIQIAAAEEKTTLASNVERAQAEAVALQAEVDAAAAKWEAERQAADAEAERLRSERAAFAEAERLAVEQAATLTADIERAKAEAVAIQSAADAAVVRWEAELKATEAEAARLTAERDAFCAAEQVARDQTAAIEQARAEAAAQLDASQAFTVAEAGRWQTELDAVTTRATQIESDRQTAQAALDAAALLADQLRADLATAEAARIETAGALDLHRSELAQTLAELEAAKTRAVQIEADREAARVVAATADALAAELRTDLARTEAAHVDTTSALETDRQALAEARATVAEVQAAIVTTQADVARLEAARAAREADAIQAAADAAAAQQARTEATAALEAAMAEAEAARQVLAEATAHLTAEREAHAKTQAMLQARIAAEVARVQAESEALRNLILRTVGVLVTKETERARRNAGTPAKLNAWADGFYLLHEETCIDALRPAMQAHLALIGSAQDVDAYTRALVHPHLETALKQLRAVIGGDGEDFPVAIERLLARWEQDRPATIAALVAQEEVTYVRSL